MAVLGPFESFGAQRAAILSTHVSDLRLTQVETCQLQDVEDIMGSDQVRTSTTQLQHVMCKSLDERLHLPLEVLTRLRWRIPLQA